MIDTSRSGWFFLCSDLSKKLLNFFQKIEIYPLTIDTYCDNIKTYQITPNDLKEVNTMTVTISSIHGDHEDIRCKAKRFDSAHAMVKKWMSGMYQHFLDADPFGLQYKIEVVGNKATVSMMFRDYDLAGSNFWKVWSDCDNLIDEVHTKYN